MKYDISFKKRFHKINRYIYQLFLLLKIYNSIAFWNYDHEVNQGLRKFERKKGKYKSLKEKIKIWVKGVGWATLHQE